MQMTTPLDSNGHMISNIQTGTLPYGMSLVTIWCQKFALESSSKPPNYILDQPAQLEIIS